MDHIGFLHRHPKLESVLKVPEGHVIVDQVDWENVRQSSDSVPANYIDLEHENALLIRLLTEVCNEYMESDDKGNFQDEHAGSLPQRVNKALGLI